MPEPTTPSTTGNTVAPQAPASTPAPSYGLTPASWAPQGKPQGNQDFSRFDKLERPNQTPASSSNEELTDPDLEEGGEKILDIADIERSPKKMRLSQISNKKLLLNPSNSKIFLHSVTTLNLMRMVKKF